MTRRASGQQLGSDADGISHAAESVMFVCCIFDFAVYSLLRHCFRLGPLSLVVFLADQRLATDAAFGAQVVAGEREEA